MTTMTMVMMIMVMMMTMMMITVVVMMMTTIMMMMIVGTSREAFRGPAGGSFEAPSMPSGGLLGAA
eukprot:6016622-Pyramimonas_sp.AAC.1